MQGSFLIYGTLGGEINMRTEQYRSYKGLMLQNVVFEVNIIINLTQKWMASQCAMHILLWPWLIQGAKWSS
jgi:hypothetical protein